MTLNKARFYNPAQMNVPKNNGNKIYISIIIPAYNEEASIKNALNEIHGFMAPGHAYEIIVVDDASSDNTSSIVEECIAERDGIILLQNPRNRGKGYSVRRGIGAAKGELCLITDADLSVPISESKSFIQLLDAGFDIAMASRYLEESNFSRPLIVKQAFGRIFNLLTRIVFGFTYRDTQCGFKMLKTERAKKLFSRCRIDRFAFDVELLLMAREDGARVKEVPVTCVNSPNSRVRLFADSAIMLKDIALLKLRK